MRLLRRITFEWYSRLSSKSRMGQQSGEPDERDIIIGKVVSVHVLRRELRIAPTTSHPERFHDLHSLRLRLRNHHTFRLAVRNIRVTGSAVIATVEAEDDAQAASARGADVVVRWSERFRLPENEYYVDELIGLVVKDKQGRFVGRLREIWNTPANDIYRVVDDKGREMLLPAIEDVILAVDIAGGEITADISIVQSHDM
ncbi:MAG: 16S rRNA processing protein RimM [Candidatus Abyssobacteria bacterium SURF_17]|uniref:Ribosome maturation factor RimM n=1 Tax=Candidatus Abyssobacteria bacterium SURF_17 TaxID=2093361 RepID=A0A419F8G0_9BACT|nr:MAG: 16S rRNA processing protein RimM [Candidatus Abyssubacteria bacterium SURF_17]